MKEYIDKEQLLDRLKTIKDSKEWDSQSEYVMYGIEQFIGKAPAADVVERKRGEWKPIGQIVRTPYIPNYFCTVCGERPIQIGNFCPNCGADMRSHQNILCDQTEEGEHESL